MNLNTQYRTHGFTLIEMIVTTVIMAILASAAVPSFTDTIRRNQVQAQADLLLSSLVTARSEAAKQNKPVTLCKSGNLSTCTTSGSWEQGWLIFVDNNGDGTLTAGSDKIVRKFRALPSGYRIHTNATAADWISYESTGSIRGSGGNGAGNFRICDSEGTVENARQIIISITGRPRQEGNVTSCS